MFSFRSLAKRFGSITISLILFLTTSCAGLFDKGPAYSTKVALDIPTAPLRDKAVSAYVNQIAQNLAKQESPERLGHQKIDVNILATSRIQGLSHFYSSGIDITRGLLNALTNEAELAALIGHEIGHKVLHSKNSMFVPKNFSTKDIEYADWSQNREKEADEYGALLASKAGYDPYALMDFFDRLSQFQKGGILAWLNENEATHKDFRNRAKYLRKFLRRSHLERGQGVMKPFEYAKALVSLKGVSTNDAVNEIVPGGPRAAIDKLAEIEAEVQSFKRDNLPMPVERFMEVMGEISDIAGLYSLEPTAIVYRRGGGTGPIISINFMKEVLSQDSPLWDSAVLSKKIADLLRLISGIGVGFIPMVGDAVDLHEILTGRDYFTQEKMGLEERVLSAAGLLAGSGPGWRTLADGIDKTFNDSRFARKLGTDARSGANMAMDRAEEVGDTSGKWGKLYADDLNAQNVSKGLQPSYKHGTKVIYRETKGEERYFRVHGEDNQKRPWLMRSDPRELSVRERVEWYALPDDYTTVSEAIVPPGTRMRVSVSGPNRFGPGGGLQWEINDEDLNRVVFNELGKAK